MQLKSILQKIGLSEKEITIYETLVELGAQPVRVIAEKSGVNRGTCYDILSSLHENGLVTYFDKQKHQYFVPEPPEKLLHLLEQKQKDLKLVKAELEENFNEIKSMYEKEGGRPLVKLYEDEAGIRQILEDVLDSMKESAEQVYYAYSAASLRKSVFDAMPDFSKQRVASNIKVMTIAIGEGGQLLGLDERKWLKTDKYLAETYELIYAGKVAHITFSEAGVPMGVVITSKAIFETQKLVFLENWKNL